LAQHAVVAVDKAPFIYLWERHPRYFSLSQALFRYLSQPNVRGITTVITLSPGFHKTVTPRCPESPLHVIPEH
jgi:hypothetical protein